MSLNDDERAAVNRMGLILTEAVLAKAEREGRIVRVEPGKGAADVIRPFPPPLVVNEPLPLLLSVLQAATLLGITRAAFDKRLQRGQIPGVFRTGRRVQIHREKFLAALERRASR